MTREDRAKGWTRLFRRGEREMKSKVDELRKVHLKKESEHDEHLYKDGAKKREERKFEREYGAKKGKRIYGATVGKVKREQEAKTENGIPRKDYDAAAQYSERDEVRDAKNAHRRKVRHAKSHGGKLTSERAKELARLSAASRRKHGSKKRKR